MVVFTRSKRWSTDEHWRRQARRERGLCPRCGREPFGGFVLCFECRRTRAKEHARARRRIGN